MSQSNCAQLLVCDEQGLARRATKEEVMRAARDILSRKVRRGASLLVRSIDHTRARARYSDPSVGRYDRTFRRCLLDAAPHFSLDARVRVMS
jgi:hypothetical protein